MKGEQDEASVSFETYKSEQVDCCVLYYGHETPSEVPWSAQKPAVSRSRSLHAATGLG